MRISPRYRRPQRAVSRTRLRVGALPRGGRARAWGRQCSGPRAAAPRNIRAPIVRPRRFSSQARACDIKPPTRWLMGSRLRRSGQPAAPGPRTRFSVCRRTGIPLARGTRAKPLRIYARQTLRPIPTTRLAGPKITRRPVALPTPSRFFRCGQARAALTRVRTLPVRDGRKAANLLICAGYAGFTIQPVRASLVSAAIANFAFQSPTHSINALNSTMPNKFTRIFGDLVTQDLNFIYINQPGIGGLTAQQVLTLLIVTAMSGLGKCTQEGDFNGSIYEGDDAVYPALDGGVYYVQHVDFEFIKNLSMNRWESKSEVPSNFILWSGSYAVLQQD